VWTQALLILDELGFQQQVVLDPFELEHLQ
jgi:hypothetical protein